MISYGEGTMYTESRMKVMEEVRENWEKMQDLIEKCYDAMSEESDTEKLRDLALFFKSDIEELADEIDMLTDAIESEY